MNLIDRWEKERLKKWSKFIIFILTAQFFLNGIINIKTCAAQKINQGGISDSVQIKKAKSPTGAMLRSLLSPGGGQLYNGKWLKAGLLFVTETGLIVNALYWDHQTKKVANAWDRDFCRNNRNLSIWWLAGVVLLSMGDAYVDAHLANFDVSPDLSKGIWMLEVKSKLVWKR